MTKQDMLQDYVMVNERITEFYSKFPDGRITTEIISNELGQIIFKAYVYKRFEDTVPSATGHAMEKEGNSFINKNSHVENCETSAVGRALALMGLSIKKSIASYEEVANAKLQQEDHKQDRVQQDKNGYYGLRDTWVMLKGDEEGFDDWHKSQWDKGIRNKDMQQTLNKKKENKQ